MMMHHCPKNCTIDNTCIHCDPGIAYYYAQEEARYEAGGYDIECFMEAKDVWYQYCELPIEEQRKYHMKKNKEPYALIKVIDPHSNMPKEIASAWLNAFKPDYNNESYINWTIGDSEEWFDDSEYKEKYSCLKKVDNWLLENGFKDGEEVMILYWW